MKCQCGWEGEKEDLKTEYDEEWNESKVCPICGSRILTEEE